MCGCLCFILRGHCDIFTTEESNVCLPAASERPGYSWSLRLVPSAMQERHLASDTLVLIITVHSPGLLFHWHRETGRSFVGYSFIPLPCWVSTARCCWVHWTRSMRHRPKYKADICQVASVLVFLRMCCFLYLLNLSGRLNPDMVTS